MGSSWKTLVCGGTQLSKLHTPILWDWHWCSASVGYFQKRKQNYRLSMLLRNKVKVLLPKEALFCKRLKRRVSSCTIWFSYFGLSLFFSNKIQTQLLPFFSSSSLNLWQQVCVYMTKLPPPTIDIKSITLVATNRKKSFSVIKSFFSF